MFPLVLQMLAALSEAGLGPQEVEHLWACYEKAKAAEEKAGFNTGETENAQHSDARRLSSGRVRVFTFQGSVAARIQHLSLLACFALWCCWAAV